MRKQFKRTAVSLALLFVCVSGISLAPAPAFASCSGAGCVHQDPQPMCSSGATSLASVRPPGGGPAVILRWSSACVANWARFDDSSGDSPGNWTYWVETSDGHKEFKTPNSAYWTFMVNGNLAAKACIQGVATTQSNCTAWF
jgi:Protein of unknown function (DUF2690)